jgi:hypothetical protein
VIEGVWIEYLKRGIVDLSFSMNTVHPHIVLKYRAAAVGMYMSRSTPFIAHFYFNTTDSWNTQHDFIERLVLEHVRFSDGENFFPQGNVVAILLVFFIYFWTIINKLI